MNYNYKKISMVVIRRLPRYYRYLGDLLKHNIKRISSKELSARMNVTASQIRQDLNCFGGFGQQGYGYNVEELYYEIGEILGLHKGHDTIIAGAGNLGHALANYVGFAKRGFRIVGVFDNDPSKVGRIVNNIEVRDISTMGEFLSKTPATIGILTVPRNNVRNVADLMIKCGIKGLLNFSYVDLDVPDDVVVENVHLSDSLMTLSYLIKQNQKSNR